MTELSQHEIDAETARLAALRMQLLEMHPFWGYMLLQVRLIAAPGLPSLMMTDCVSRIWFDPRQTRELDRRELGFVLMHEICHQVLATNERQQQREPRKWDYATDYAINDLVAEIPIPGAGSYSEDRYLYRMPPEGLYSRRYHNWIAETIYEDLCRRKDFAPEVRFFDLSLPGGSG